MSTAIELVAILRGLQPERAQAVGEALCEAGFDAIEVPLNRPNALRSIEVLAQAVGGSVQVGAGTVMSVSDVDAVVSAGGRLIVSPHCDVQVIQRACSAGLTVAPGVFTATEAFTALRSGAHALKLFPAEALGPAGLAALATVLPAGTRLWPVGGVTPERLAAWVRAGATGFGLGGALFRPEWGLDQVMQQARAFRSAREALASQAT